MVRSALNFTILVFLFGKINAKGLYVSWSRHKDVGGRYEDMFYPTNNIEEYEYLSELQTKIPGTIVQAPFTQDQDYSGGLEALKDIIDKAMTDGKRLRPLGSRWSYNNLPYTDEYMIDTYGLNYAQIGLQQDVFVTNAYQGDSKNFLAFVQGGCVTKALYRSLFAKGLTLQTSAQADGQTVAGAVNTGTHNSANRVGSFQDMVKGIHIVLPEGRSAFIQPESDPVVTQAYMSEIGADELIQDDHLFYAALVAGGTFGVVHGYLIETVRLFRLDVDARNFPYSECSKAMFSLDLGSLFEMNDDSITHGTPWHFDAYINPYDAESQDGCKVRVMQKVPLDDLEVDHVINELGIDYDPNYVGDGGDPLRVMYEFFSNTPGMSIWGPGLFSSTSTIEAIGRKEVYKAGIQFFMESIGEYIGPAFPMEIYGWDDVEAYYTFEEYQRTSMEVAVAFEHTEEAVETLMQVLDLQPAPVMFQLRFVKTSRATLAASTYGKNNITAYINFPGLNIPDTRNAYRLLQKAMEKNRDRILFKFHMGKVNPANDEWVKRSYGVALDEWKALRRNFLRSNDACHVFSNEFTDTLGLTGQQESVPSNWVPSDQ